MKHRFILCIAAALIISMLIFPGCIRLREHLESHLDDVGKFCKIKTFIYTIGPSTDTVVFHYNALGDPVSGTWPQRAPHTNFYFRYDQHNRLQDFMAIYPTGGTGVFWTRFFYANEGSKNPFCDSIYVYPTDVTRFPPVTPYPIQWDNFEYDEFNRVSRVIFNSSGSVPFNYDSKGDLILTGVQFNGPDDKVNFNRTSRIFQFLNWDYAVNNTFIADKYNSYGLPTEISIPFAGEGSEGFLGIPYVTAKVEYECK